MLIFLEILQLICVVVLFVIVKRQEKSLRQKEEEIFTLNKEIEKLKLDISKRDANLSQDAIKINTEVFSILMKIKKNFSISKSDKLRLLDFLVVYMRSIDKSLLYKVNTSRKMTYKEATEFILEYLRRPLFTGNQVQGVLDSVFFLLTK